MRLKDFGTRSCSSSFILKSDDENCLMVQMTRRLLSAHITQRVLCPYMKTIICVPLHIEFRIIIMSICLVWKRKIDHIQLSSPFNFLPVSF